MRARCHRLQALLLAASLLLSGAAACSGDDGDGGSASDVLARTNTESDAAAGDDGAGGDGAGGDGAGGDGAGDPSTTTETTEPDVSGIDRDEDFCEGWLEAEKAFDTDQFDPAALDDMLPVLQDLAGKAPSELQDEMELLSEAFSRALPFFAEMTRLNEEAMRDPSKRESIQAELSRLSAEVDVFSSPEFERATARVSAYAEQKCGAGPG